MSSSLTAERTSVNAHTKAGGPGTRLTALDGLRGVAAIVVVLYHLFLVAESVLRRQGGSGVGSPLWFMSQTPLKLMTAGSEAVLVFFVLSGLVVALPALKPGSFSWSGFLSGRLARLYLPVWVSIVIGTLLIWLIPRDDSTVGQGTWMDTSQATSTNWSTFLTEASLIRFSYDLNNVLWSLRWELLFSVLLPLFLALAVVTARYWVIALTAAVALSTIGVLSGIDGLRYLPVFFIGTLMAVQLEAIREWMRRRLLRRRSTLWGVALAGGRASAAYLPMAPATTGTGWLRRGCASGPALGARCRRCGAGRHRCAPCACRAGGQGTPVARQSLVQPLSHPYASPCHPHLHVWGRSLVARGADHGSAGRACGLGIQSGDRGSVPTIGAAHQRLGVKTP